MTAYRLGVDIGGTFTDIVLLVLFSEVLTLCRVVAMRALARFKRAQRSINALYEPPAW